MSPRSSTFRFRATRAAAALLVALLFAACAATSGAAAPSAQPTTAATVPATPRPTATASESPGTSGATDYALWIERQGFGGSSGLRQVIKDAEWIRDHAFDATLFDVEDTTRHARLLATWLDEHPATSCWTEYHATIRAALGRLLDAYAAAHDARAAGKGIPLEVGETLVAQARSAFDLPAPAGC